MPQLPQDWKNYQEAVEHLYVGRIMRLDSKSTTPTISIYTKEGDEIFSRTISKSAIERIINENVGKFLKEKNLKPQFNNLAKRLLR